MRRFTEAMVPVGVDGTGGLTYCGAVKRAPAAALVLILVLLAVPAASASTWSEPQPLFGEGEIYALTGTPASGGIMAVARVDGGMDAAIRPPGGAFGEPFAL